MVRSDGVSLKKTEVLRSRNLFKRIALEGRRLDGGLLRCSFLIHNEGGMQLQVGFKISSRKYNAVQRNRIRRLMREGIVIERKAIDEVLREKSSCVGIIFSYKGMKEVSVVRLKLAIIQKDLRLMCRTIASAL